MENLPRNFCAFSCHEVTGHNGTKCYSVVVGSEIAHYAYGTHISEGCEILAQVLIYPCFGNFLTVNSISFLYNLYLLCSNLTDNADTETRTREWLAVYQIFWNTQLTAGIANLILKEEAQWLNDFLKVYTVRETAYIVMGFNNSGLA